jgi:hypothetical protein
VEEGEEEDRTNGSEEVEYTADCRCLGGEPGLKPPAKIFSLVDTLVRASPAVVNGKVFFLTGKEAALAEVEKEGTECTRANPFVDNLLLPAVEDSDGGSGADASWPDAAVVAT